MNTLNRRDFLAASAATVPWLTAMTTASQTAGRRPTIISSRNGLHAIEHAMTLLRDGADPLDAIVTGVNEVENDPRDMSVGYGGLPNEEGVVELDASVMHGPTHKAGAVAALRNIRNPSSVALEVLRRTDHVLIVGSGALAFARSIGFEEQNLLTEQAREAWVRWKANLSPDDDWLDTNQQIEIPHTDGTIHVSAVDANGDLGACTSTSGLSYKIPGRVGDSPIVGAGMFCDNAVGAAGSTGRGESVIQSAGAFQVVRNMADGHEPTEACLRVLKWIADHTKRPDLLNDRGEPNFQVVMYALRKDGAYGAASMRPGRDFAVHDGTEARPLPCAILFDS
ncbi:MAG: N(4)-(beta-N-acetylglucosaminyl)-L-asparaginase [Planctomycetota bacterium]|jgi:N4-(beta-N-acetylglucosaminyl)-L-asparaginase